MARRETGAWLPISAVAAGFVLYATGITIFWLVDFSRSSPIVFLTALACVVVSLLPLPAVCAWSNPWWRFSGAAVSVVAVQMLLIEAIISVENWMLGQTPQWQDSGWAFALCAFSWSGYRQFLKARKDMRESMQSKGSPIVSE
jgi:hypothetical protein